MNTLFRIIAFAAAIGVGDGRGAVAPELIQATRQSCVVVEVRTSGRNRSFGNAFCLGPGLFMATQSVLAHAEVTTFPLIIDAASDHERVVEAKVLRANKELGLVLLGAPAATNVPALQLADAVTLSPGMKVITCWHPTRLIRAPGKRPNMDFVTAERAIKAVRRIKNGMEVVELQRRKLGHILGTVVVDGRGQVVGVTSPCTREIPVHNAVLPVEWIRKLLEQPVLIVRPPTVTFDSRTTVQPFAAHLIETPPATEPRTVKLTLSTGPEDHRVLAVEATGDGAYAVSTVPVPAAAARLRLVAQTAAGMVECTVADRPLSVAKRVVQLSSVRRIEPGVTTLGDGSKLAGRVTGLDEVEARVGDLPVTANLTSATMIAVAPLPAATVHAINWRVSARTGDQLLATAEGIVRVENVPLARPGIRPAPLAEPLKTISLPAPVDDLVAGGAGRYLLLSFKTLRHLGVFDVNAANISRMLPLADHDVLLAANVDKCIVVYPGQNRMERWDLPTLRKEATGPTPIEGVYAIAMGHASGGPLLVNGQILVDPYTFQRMDHRATGRRASQQRIGLRAGGDGRTFGRWSKESAPSGLEVGTVTDHEINWIDEHESVGYVVPSFDGRMIFTVAGPHTPLGKPIDGKLMRRPCLPTADPRFYVEAQAIEDRQPGLRPAKMRYDYVLHVGGDSRKTVKLPAMRELAPEGELPWQLGGLTQEKRLHVIPAAKLIVTLSYSRDQLVLRRFDVGQALNQTGVEVK